MNHPTVPEKKQQAKRKYKHSDEHNISFRRQCDYGESLYT